MKHREEFIIYLRPTPPGLDRLGRDAVQRLKFILKRLGRDHGLMCFHIEHEKPDSDAPADQHGHAGDDAST